MHVRLVPKTWDHNSKTCLQGRYQAACYCYNYYGLKNEMMIQRSESIRANLKK